MNKDKLIKMNLGPHIFFFKLTAAMCLLESGFLDWISERHRVMETTTTKTKTKTNYTLQFWTS